MSINAKELIEWVNTMCCQNYTVYIGINGGGVTPVDGGFDFNDPSIYATNAVELVKGSEMKDFKSLMTDEEYKDSKFFVIKHLNDFNAENMDIQIAYYSI